MNMPKSQPSSSFGANRHTRSRRAVSRSRAFAALLATFLGLALSTLFSGTAMAGTTQTTCSNYDKLAVVQTSTKWARVSTHACVEFDGTQVRPVVQMRSDWPLDCSVTVSADPSMTCNSMLGFKSTEITFNSVELFSRYTAPSASRVDGSCKFSNYTASAPLTGGQKFLTCAGTWAPIQQGGTYTIDYTDAQADVKDDGQGNKTIPGDVATFQQFGDTFIWKE